MFFKIDNVNYFVIPDEKSSNDIFQEIFARMQTHYITEQEKRKILAEIRKQLS